MPPFMVRCVEVKRRMNSISPTRIDTFFHGKPGAWEKAKTQSPTLSPPPVKVKATSPSSWVILLGFFLSLSLFIASIVVGDGMSLLATVSLSLLSTLTGVANKWSLKLPQRRKGTDPPCGDVVIRYPNGSYLYVKCDEQVARELYFAPEEIEYNMSNPVTYRMISLAGTLILMLGIIFLANAKLQLQFAWAGAYIIINAAHWIAAAIPPKKHWDLSCYELKEQSIVGGPENTSFTEALWKAVLLAKSTRWVRTGKAAPETPVWDEWLHEAEENARLCRHHVGPLINPVWPGKNPSKSIIWELPHEWDAKTAWKRLNEEGNEGPKTGTLRAAEAECTSNPLEAEMSAEGSAVLHPHTPTSQC